jgi:hypothetical protein
MSAVNTPRVQYRPFIPYEEWQFNLMVAHGWGRNCRTSVIKL